MKEYLKAVNSYTVRRNENIKELERQTKAAEQKNLPEQESVKVFVPIFQAFLEIVKEY